VTDCPTVPASTTLRRQAARTSRNSHTAGSRPLRDLVLVNS
jgi:hypothetical protein